MSLALVALAQRPAAPAYPTDIRADVRVEADVAYLSADRAEKADLYFPNEMPKGQRLPAVVIIHGGGFNDGDKARAREFNIGGTLARNGYIGMSINYKLAKNADGTFSATWPQPLYDAKTAVRWLRKHAARLQVDPDRIGVIGGSAGGTLAALLALTGPRDGVEPREPYGEFSARVQCAVDFYGPAKLLDYHDMQTFGKTRAEAPELYTRASPVTYVDKNDAPLLIVHGTADETVSHTQSEALNEACRKAGARCELVLIEGAPHTFDLQPKQRDLRPLVLGFFEKHLKRP